MRSGTVRTLARPFVAAIAAVALLGAAMFAPLARACQMHQMIGQPEPIGIWPSFSQTYQDFQQSLSPAATSNVLSLAPQTAAALAAAPPVTDPSITAWVQNLTNLKGSSPNSTINTIVSQVSADVQTVAYSSSNVYIKTQGIPSHAIGPFNGNPNNPSAQNRTVRIPRTPQVNNGTKTGVGLGNIAVAVNGTAFFNAQDAMSYLNQNVWHQNANVFEASGFDATGPGHPQQQGNYHYHNKPTGLLNRLDPGNTGQKHSSIVGFAFDGYPIYGPYGYANADGTGGIVRETSSYRTRNITTRTTLANGTSVSAGPTVASVALGSYIEDYEYVAGLGTLDQYNGRFVVTPEYPQGTYAYFITVDAAGSPAYPYVLGPQYYGVVDTGNLAGGTIVVPSDVTFYTAPEPGAVGLIVFGAIGALAKRRKA
jgi:hypothetical protein